LTPFFNWSEVEEEKIKHSGKIENLSPSLTQLPFPLHIDEEGNVLSFPLNLIHPNFFLFLNNFFGDIELPSKY
jgi:hypothetical protein